jgi:3-oxoacyl-[acyl-carrier-protein] synthase-3
MNIERVKRNEQTITMNGKEVFKIAVRSMEEISRQALDDAGVSVDQVSLVIPHQANRRIITALAARLNVPMERVVVNLEKYGNTSAASVPVALDEARKQGRISANDIVLLNAFGAGFAWGAAVIRF